MWVLFEAYHDVTYFTPESRAASDALGCKGGWMGYFGMRSAPLGAVPPELVQAAFYNFHPWMVRRAIPDAWQIASPERYLEARLSGVDAALRRMLGPTVAELSEAAELAAEAARHAQIIGRPLAAANAATELPAEPYLALWQAATVLRESRGDGHVATLVAAPLDAVEALVLHCAYRGLSPEYMRQARGWSEPEWAEAEARLADRGLMSSGAITQAGTDLRERIERRTDELAEAPWTALGPERTRRLAELLKPVVLTLADQNAARNVNPMALDVRGALAGRL
jgi:hypothetical protein